MRLNVYKIKHSNYSIGFLFQVHFPDVERVEWLNKVPYVCVCVCVGWFHKNRSGSRITQKCFLKSINSLSLSFSFPFTDCASDVAIYLSVCR